MQSLNRFMELKKAGLGIRTSMENFGRIGHIEIYPLYAIENFLFIKPTAILETKEDAILTI